MFSRIKSADLFRGILLALDDQILLDLLFSALKTLLMGAIERVVIVKSSEYECTGVLPSCQDG